MTPIELTVDTTEAVATLRLPLLTDELVSAGQVIKIIDGADNAATHNITVTGAVDSNNVICPSGGLASSSVTGNTNGVIMQFTAQENNVWQYEVFTRFED